MRKNNSWFFRCTLLASALILLLAGQALALEVPAPPILNSPAHGAYVAGTTVELDWEAPAGATHYNVWVFNLSTDQLLYFDMVAGDTTFTVEGLPDYGDYIAWSVVAGDAGTGLWGDFAVPRIFQSGTDKAMAPPTLISPADGINISGTTVDFVWDAPEGALAYHIAIINDTTGELLHFNEILFLGHEKEFTFDGLPDNGDTILWTVVAAIDIGVWSDFAFPRTFANGVTADATGNWSVEESFSGAITSDFTVTVVNLDQATYYELYIGGVRLGDRVAIDEYVRSVSIVFTNPEEMEVMFFSSSSATSPLAVAGCAASGELIF